MKISAGIILLYKNKVLLCHPTNASEKNNFSFPKGGVEKNESVLDAAIRECKEEIGITVNKNDISKEEYIINYTKKDSKKIFKRVHLFTLRVHKLEEINMKSDIIPTNQLQSEEIDWAGFLTKKQAKEKIFWRFRPLINKIFS